MTKTTFNAKAVAPLYLFSAKNDIRFYLAGMFVTPAPTGDGIIIATCDGHRLAMWHDQAGTCSESKIFKITPAFVAACKRRIKGDTLPRKVSYIDGRLILSAGDEELFIQAGKAEIDAKYPDIFRVVPSNNKLVPGLHGNINAEFLKTIADAAKMAVSDNRFGNAISHFSSGSDGNGAIVTRFDNAENFMVVTMPMRGRNDPRKLKPIPASFIAPDNETSVPATMLHPMGSMGEEVTP